MAVPPEPTPDPYSNKAIVAAVIALFTLVGQFFWTDQELQVKQEGVTAFLTVVVPMLVWAVSNRKKLLG